MTTLQRSESHSADDSCSEGGADQLTELFAGGDAAAIATALLEMRATLTRDEPDTVYVIFNDSLPEWLRAATQPFALVLRLLDTDALRHRPTGKVDLRTLLVRALRSMLQHQQQSADDFDSQAAPSPSPPPPELTAEITAQAREMCLRGTFLSPRTFEAVHSVYRVQLSEAELLSYARACFAAGAYRDAAEFLRTFHLENDEPTPAEVAAGASPSSGFPHALLLTHLVEDKQSMDVFLSYLSQSPAFLARHVHDALTNLAEHTNQQTGLPGGNDANLAAKLALKFGFPLSQFPRIVYLKKKELVWWLARIGKAGDFGEMLAGDDKGLQRKLLRELSRSRNLNDRLLACSFLDKWPHHLKEREYQQLYEQQKQLCLQQPPPLTIEQRIEQNIQTALQLHNEAAPADSAAAASLLLPPLPAAADSADSAELPLLLLHPRSIVMVDSLESLADARAHLLAPTCSSIGLDLEHLPENFEGLKLKPALCQLLQIACHTKTFLFDLQVLNQPSQEDGAAAAVPSAAVDGTAASVASSTSSSPFPSLRSTSLPPAPFNADLVSDISDLLVSLFVNSDVLKVGIGFAQDMRKLRLDFGHLVCFQITLQSYVELTPLLRLIEDPDAETRERARKQQAADARRRAAAKKQKIGGSDKPAPTAAGGLSSLFGGSDDSSVGVHSTPAVSSSTAAAGPRCGGGYTQQAKKEGGLARLVRMVMRRTLDKSQQISNWAQRPLSVAQQQYAALDAYVCIIIQEEAAKRGIELDAENIDSSL